MFEQVSYRNFALMALAAPILAACAGDPGRYPSLAYRDAERIGTEASTTQAAQISPLSEANVGRVATLLSEARESHQQFVSQRASALALARAASGLSSEDDRLARAMVAAAELSSLRGSTSVALGGLDELHAQAASNFVETRVIEAAQADIAQMIAEQDADLAAIERAMR